MAWEPWFQAEVAESPAGKVATPPPNAQDVQRPNVAPVIPITTQPPEQKKAASQ